MHVQSTHNKPTVARVSILAELLLSVSASSQILFNVFSAVPGMMIITVVIGVACIWSGDGPKLVTPVQRGLGCCCCPKSEFQYFELRSDA